MPRRYSNQSRVAAAFIVSRTPMRHWNQRRIMVTWALELECGALVDRQVRSCPEEVWEDRPQRAECACTICRIRAGEENI